ncbi:BTAD domain-containing putative transcriptional regulator [Amycolatopsis minnesotensis]|uniref:BTAD domain-containing putative transcriptional regulator n=1 Tax=Amycolatopsis minnesotensis TaxID=337894 RepID=A0ABN2S1Q2_9PSEU
MRALLANLLLQPGRAVSADRLAAELWGDRPPGNPANTLQTKVSQLRRTLEAAEAGGRELVAFEPGGYVLRIEPGAVDVGRFHALVSRAKLTPVAAARSALLAEALALWRGPALADFADEPFAAPMIRLLDEDRLAAKEDWAESRLSLGEHREVVGELADLVAANPVRERLRGLHLRALYRSGRQTEALDGYRELRDRLADELGLTPGAEIAELHQAILTQDPALGDGGKGAEVPPRTNLPVPLTPLVGRDTAVRAVRERLGETRLVTLTGPGGVGKTRLAVETAGGLTAAFDAGVWLIEFAGLDRGGCAALSCPPEEWMAEVTASALGIRADPAGAAGATGDLASRIEEALRAKEILLVLDNCEQFVAPVAALAARLLRAVPGLRVLATSQEPLGLAGEVVWAVPPLEVPGTASLQPGHAAEDVLAAVRESPAVQLFTARAAAAAPGFALGTPNAAAVAVICRKLDGIPLALELAATRIRALGAHELLNRLGDRFRLLDGGHRDAPARQRTLRAMIDWSWELLSEPERIVLRRLAVHAESCGLEAAEAVCSGAGVAPGEVLGLLDGLVGRSLVVSQLDQQGGPRYRLLESVAAYCLDRAREAGESESLLARHARHYLEFAERAEAGLRGPDQQRWLLRVDVDAANVRAALETLIRQGEAELALRLATTMAWYWFLRGRLPEARRSLRSALAAPGAATETARANALAWQAGIAVLEGEGVDESGFEEAQRIDDPAVQGKVLWFLGHVLATVGKIPAGQRLTGQALSRFRRIDFSWGIAAALSDTAGHAMASGDFTLAERDATRSAELFDRVGDRWGQLQAAFALGVLAQLAGDYDRAASLHRDGLRLAQELGLWPEMSYQLSWLGRVAMLRGDFAAAADFHQRALHHAVEQRFKPAEVYAETGLALGARREGKLDVAEKHLRSVLSWHRGGGFEGGSALILAELGFIAELRGDAAKATELQREGLALAERSADPRAIALGMEGLAGAMALSGEHRAAAALLGAAAAKRASVGTPLPEGERGDVDRIEAAAREALGGELFTAEFERGGREPDEHLR